MHPFTSNTGQLLQKPLETFKRIVFTYTKEEDMFCKTNDCDKGKTQWVVSVGNLLGLFDKIG
jgi:hypothetical protein